MHLSASTAGHIEQNLVAFMHSGAARGDDAAITCDQASALALAYELSPLAMTPNAVLLKGMGRAALTVWPDAETRFPWMTQGFQSRSRVASSYLHHVLT